MNSWKIFIFFVLSLTISSCSQEKQVVDENIKKYSYKHPISFQSENYICFYTQEPIKVDGKDDEPVWEKVLWTNDFVDIEGNLKPNPQHNTRVKMLWDENYFYFLGRMEEPHVWAKLRQRDTVIFYDDDFEIFIDPDGDSHNYYELEMNAFNTLWELILLRPYRADGDPKVLFNWNIPDIKTAVHVEGTLNNPKDIDKYWSIEVAIPWTALKEFAPEERKPKQGEQWRVNFSRVDWTMTTENGFYEKVRDPNSGKSLPENNWVWSPTGRINMHMPEMWGYVQFSEKRPGSLDPFIHHLDEEVKWALWNLYFQQLAYFKENNKFSNNINHFTIPELSTNKCEFQPELFVSPYWFEIVAKSCEGNGVWRIRRDGKVEMVDGRG